MPAAPNLPHARTLITDAFEFSVIPRKYTRVYSDLRTYLDQGSSGTGTGTGTGTGMGNRGISSLARSTISIASGMHHNL